MRINATKRKMLLIASFVAIAAAAIVAAQFVQPVEKSALSAAAAGEPKGHSAIGPGGCTTYDSCKTYCQDPAHYDECVKSGGPWMNGSPNPYVAGINVSN